MATAGTPPRMKPSAARSAKSTCQSGERAAAMWQSEAPSMEKNIRPRRPKLSEKAPASMMATARLPVVSDSASELSAGLTP